MIRDGNNISGNQRQEWEMFKLMGRALGDKAPFCFQPDCEVTLPSLFVFSQM